ncbi:M13 family metallopeptidase [Aliidiomarina halalkaliphila]|uniref:M13 family metallopeptidase n=1 Tax=Aliidiomarina halalkaliphila TaxID=2593535 RepID=A0A552X4Z6_9GAMM|nr:M13 family metallopeptidase [Aliidiomarina halalkaliphila]TRW49683.1 M13 family metallopeptidase [Aliidiomarina halalkaliphila]
MKHLSTVAISVALALGLAACSDAPRSTVETEQAQQQTVSGIELHNMDTSVRPQDNFFRYVNGGWLANTEIPSDRARWGSFDELREAAEEHVQAIVQEFAAVDAEAGSNQQKIGDLYRSYMDEERIESLGLSPLSADFETIAALSSHDELVRYWGEQQRYRAGTPFAIFVGQDQMQSDQHITAISQSGLGLPDREYYLASDDRNAQIRSAYTDFIATLWDAAEWEGGEEAAQRILAVETAIAEHHWTRIQNRDRLATYNKLTIAELNEVAPGLAWDQVFAHAGLEIDEVVVRQPAYLTSFAAMYQDISVEEWQDYLRFHTLRSAASMLPEAFASASFDFYGRTLQGLQEQRSRERLAVSTVESVLGFMVGEEYVARHYQPEAEVRMAEMVDNILVAFGEAIDDLDWMTEETKQEAHAKLATFNTKIGYPEVWRDYDCVTIDSTDLVGNMRRAASCEYDRNIARLGQEVDPTDWGMTPQTVNAYYRATMNEIVFPAAILQPPFFNVDADDAVNYGAIGAVIGHEIVHGFDDQGRRSDGEGNLRDWWSPVDEERFRARADLMVEQFNAFNPIDDLHLQGALMLGENIADLGGLNVALRAYRNSLEGNEAPEIDGFTGEQRFFAGWGQIWRIKFRDEALRRQVIVGPHSPGKYRVLGPLSNMPEFYEAYGVEAGDPMYRDEEVRVKIW